METKGKPLTIAWVKQNPLGALLGAAIFATLVYFFGFVRLFSVGTESTAVWAWRAWNPENNYEHAVLILPIAVFIIWWERDKLRNAPISSSRWGWLFLVFGLFLFFAGARTVQGRGGFLGLPLFFFFLFFFCCGRAGGRRVG